MGERVKDADGIESKEFWQVKRRVKKSERKLGCLDLVVASFTDSQIFVSDCSRPPPFNLVSGSVMHQ